MIYWKLKLAAVISILIVMIIITIFVKKDRILIKYSILWYLSLTILMLFSIFPEVLGKLAKLVDIQVSSNLLFVLLIAFLFFISISLTVIVSDQKKQIRKLIQEVSMLKKEQKK